MAALFRRSADCRSTAAGMVRSPARTFHPRRPMSPSASVPTCGDIPFVPGSTGIAASASNAARRAGSRWSIDMDIPSSARDAFGDGLVFRDADNSVRRQSHTRSAPRRNANFRWSSRHDEGPACRPLSRDPLLRSGHHRPRRLQGRAGRRAPRPARRRVADRRLPRSRRPRGLGDCPRLLLHGDAVRPRRGRGASTPSSPISCPAPKRAARHGIDAIYLSLHGAMVSESLDDVEGEVLRRLRAVPGLEQVPLFGVFDLHANLTEAMTRLADGLVCYRENPHIDARDTAVRAAELLARMPRNRRAPADAPAQACRSSGRRPAPAPPTCRCATSKRWRARSKPPTRRSGRSMSSPDSPSPTWPMRAWRSRW